MGMPPAHMPSAEESKGFFSGLFDLSFKNLVAPKVIKVLYIIYLIFICIGILFGLGTVLMALVSGEIIGALIALVVLPIGVVFGLIMGRIYFELIILSFRILETLDSIDKNTKRG